MHDSALHVAHQEASTPRAGHFFGAAVVVDFFGADFLAGWRCPTAFFGFALGFLAPFFLAGPEESDRQSESWRRSAVHA